MVAVSVDVKTMSVAEPERRSRKPCPPEYLETNPSASCSECPESFPFGMIKVQVTGGHLFFETS